MFIKPFFIICKVTNTQICQQFEICSSSKIFVLDPGIEVLFKCQHMILLCYYYIVQITLKEMSTFSLKKKHFAWEWHLIVEKLSLNTDLQIVFNLISGNSEGKKTMETKRLIIGKEPSSNSFVAFSFNIYRWYFKNPYPLNIMISLIIKVLDLLKSPKYPSK